MKLRCSYIAGNLMIVWQLALDKKKVKSFQQSASHLHYYFFFFRLFFNYSTRKFQEVPIGQALGDRLPGLSKI
jgi:hypothetical protein